MGRAPIRNKNLPVSTDNGSVLFSVVAGEQFKYSIRLGWLSDLIGFTFSAKIVEAKNATGDGENVPFQEADAANVYDLPVFDPDPTDNEFDFVIPKDLISNWQVKPKPDDPVYGYIAVSVADAGVGLDQQIFVPIRGLVEFRYNPVETI